MWRAKSIKLSLFLILLTSAKFSASRFQWCAKALWFSNAAWEGQPGWAAVQDRDTGRLLHPFSMTPPACLSLLCSFWLPLLGWLPGVFLWARGFCQHNCQSTISANICLLHPSLSSNRISFFFFPPKLIKNTPTHLPVAPCWRLSWPQQPGVRADFHAVLVRLYLLSPHQAEPLAASLQETCHFYLILLDSWEQFSLAKASSVLKIYNLG